MSYVLIKETESFTVEYNESTNEYRVSFFENCHYVDEISFSRTVGECDV